MDGPSSSAVIGCPLQQEHELATATKVHRGKVQALQNKNTVDAQQVRGQQDPRSQGTTQIWKEIPSAEWDRQISSRADVRRSERSYPDGPSCSWMEPPAKIVPGDFINQSLYD